MEEIEHLESCPDVPKGRPNTMNNYGVLLSDFGFDEHFLTPLRLNYLGDVARALYPEWCNPLATPDNEGDPPLDSHRGFVVSYDAETAGKDVDLDTHFDDAEVTLNVCLGRAFQGGDLYFTAIHQVNEHEEAETHMPVIIEHAVGTGVLHRGRQYHGAFPIEAGVSLVMGCTRNASEDVSNSPVLAAHELDVERVSAFALTTAICADGSTSIRAKPPSASLLPTVLFTLSKPLILGLR
ncbi:unnamed protein product [Cyprideis torosa]|uniref:Uncharacterized protein n=1 Tax=Cyprideis torosa TaxID=163714 RepID=A0A7R8W7V6_9CRUS|nr:unnamed protein product [Cyprideis torosa]CAG0887980.1 unnamed protein product [Cyprideis torosa]